MGLKRIIAALALLLSSEAPARPLLAGLPFLQRCESEGARLWGIPLCAPVVAVDPVSGSFRTSAEAPGPLPSGRANTAIKWQGADWIMVLEPLPADPAALLELLFHESFHVHQQALGLPPNNAVAQHLAGMRERYWLRLEWIALAEALRTSGRAREGHVAQALGFRAHRISSDKEAADAERRQMRHEGLASYTGAALSGEPIRMALGALAAGPGKPSLQRSFAYAGGPAWGLLLDRLRAGWKRDLGSGSDLPDMIPLAPATIVYSDRYGGSQVLAEESLLANQRALRLRAALEATAPAHALMLPLAQMHMDFDPNRVSTAPDGSLIYEKITLSDRWGRIVIDGAILRIAPDYSAAFVSRTLPEGTLHLSDGWRIEEQPGGGTRLVPPAP